MILGLPAGAILTIDLDQHECLVECRDGKAWITKADDSRDYCLKSGQKLNLSGRGKAVIQTVSDASIAVFSDSGFVVRVSEVTCRNGYGLHPGRLHRLLKAWSHSASRLQRVVMNCSVSR